MLDTDKRLLNLLEDYQAYTDMHNSDLTACVNTISDMLFYIQGIDGRAIETDKQAQVILIGAWRLANKFLHATELALLSRATLCAYKPLLERELLARGAAESNQ